MKGRGENRATSAAAAGSLFRVRSGENKKKKGEMREEIGDQIMLHEFCRYSLDFSL